jgi:hypothetical protein
MRVRSKKTERSEQGAALVIALFTLMLISVVATALILMAGTQAAVKGNYKSSMHAFYDAKAGLEEARGRLWAFNANNINNCVFPAPGAPMPIDRVCYITNPSTGEVVDPTNLDPANPYADSEYNQEFQKDVTAATGLQPFIPSTSRLGGGIAGPLYKWVRITPRTEYSGQIDVDGINGLDAANPLFYDGTQQLLGNPGGASQVLTITALSVTPYGSRRMVQYTVALRSFATAMPTFPSALVLNGNNVAFRGPSSKNGFYINGNDMDAASGTSSGVAAIGVTNTSDSSSVAAAAIPSSIYLSPSGVTAVSALSLAPLLQTPSSLDAMAQALAQNADLVLTPGNGKALDQSSLPSTMSATNPMLVVVNGDFNLHGYSTGYGLLLVTGKLDYDPYASWKGLIFVIGQGIFTSSKRGVGEIDGGVFIAKTQDSAGNLLPDPNLGAASFTQTGGGSGIHYSSKWVAAAQRLTLTPYQVLSFREIAQTTP